MENNWLNFANFAVNYDYARNYIMAVEYYEKAINALLEVQKDDLHVTINNYITRVEELQTMINEINLTSGTGPERPAAALARRTEDIPSAAGTSSSTRSCTLDTSSMYSARTETDPKLSRAQQVMGTTNERAQELQREADRFAAMGHLDEAIRRCLDAGDIFQSMVKEASDPDTKLSLHRQLKSVVDRCEELQKIRRETYSKEEKDILRRNSTINGHLYLPFQQDEDFRAKNFQSQSLFTDRDGDIALSDKQQKSFLCWKRPRSFLQKPQLIHRICSESIRQTVLSNCSLVSSMIVLAQYEQLFNRSLIRNIIYPSEYNSCGKYIVKLRINGVERRVIIDDRLPIGKDDQLLCSYSTNCNELWVSLLEKAYMKVMGGYGFSGSNSHIDLHALTAWIPERIPIKADKPKFNKDREFECLFTNFHKGNCLITVATSEIDEVEAKRTGLVSKHAYAVRDIRKVEGHRLFQLKNPWGKNRWRGNFSEIDKKNWTPQLQKALNFDLKGAKLTDNGVFWIDYDSLCHFFDVIFVNWDPKIFQHKTCIHSTWTSRTGAQSDDGNSIRYNPQYKLWVKQGTPVWILFTRHITDKVDFFNNREHMDVAVYRGSTRRVYSPDNPYQSGMMLNCPIDLIKFQLDSSITAENGMECVHLVVRHSRDPDRRMERSTSSSHNAGPKRLDFTLQVFTNEEPCLIRNLLETYKFVRSELGQWKGTSAGGIDDAYGSNPTFQLQVADGDSDNMFLVELELQGPSKFAVGFKLVRMTSETGAPSGAHSLGSSETIRCGPYGFGYKAIEANLTGGVYNLIVSTLKADQEGDFKVKVSSSRQFEMQRL